MDLNLSEQQKLVLSQSQVQQLKILQMSVQDLEEYIENIAEENPLIELKQMEEDPVGDGDSDDVIFDREEESRYFSPNDLAAYAENSASQFPGESFEEYIRAQLPDLEGVYESAAEILLQSFDHNGWITDPVDVLEHRFGISRQVFQKVLTMIQACDPPGTGAGGLQECLEIQLKRKGICSRLHEEILYKYLYLVAQKKWDLIAERTGCSKEEVQKAVQDVTGLDPIPSDGFSMSTTIPYIVPDVIVEEETDTDGKQTFAIILNHTFLPLISWNHYYESILQNSKDPKVSRYLKEKKEQAVWLVNSLNYREKLLYQCSRQIILQQRDFFAEHASLRPYRMEDLAHCLGVSKSTISRTMKNKYLECSRGTFPMHCFFVSSASKEGSFTREQVMELLKHIIAGEDRSHPLTDQQIVEKLQACECSVSRRTVAKYREELSIPPAGRRKL